MAIPVAALAFMAAASHMSANNTNKVNRDIADNTNKLNYRMFREQNLFNIDQWNRQNAYNTPEAQRKRFEQAGINPYFALGNISAGNAESLTSASPAPAVGYTHQNEFSDAISTFAEGYKMNQAEAQRRYIDSQREGQDITNQYLAGVYEIDLEKKRQEIGLTKKDIEKRGAEIANLQAETDGKLLANAFQKEANPKILEEIGVRISKTITETDYIKAQKLLAHEELKMKPLERQKMVAEIAHISATIKYISSQIDLNAEQVKLLAAQGLKVSEEATGLKIDNRIKLATEQEVVKSARISNEVEEKKGNLYDSQKWLNYANIFFGAIRATLDIGSAVMTRGASLGFRGAGQSGPPTPSSGQVNPTMPTPETWY